MVVQNLLIHYIPSYSPDLDFILSTSLKICQAVVMRDPLEINGLLMLHVQGVPRVKVTTSGECSLC